MHIHKSGMAKIIPFTIYSESKFHQEVATTEQDRCVSP